MKMTSGTILWIMVAAFFASLFLLNHNNVQYIHFNGLVLYLLAWGIAFSFAILRMNRKR